MPIGQAYAFFNCRASKDEIEAFGVTAVENLEDVKLDAITLFE